MIRPIIIKTIQEGYNFSFLKKDFLSGLTVAIVAIPLSIAFAIASGATPIVGIFTAIIGGIFVSLFGGSKYNISGPAGAFIGIIYHIIAHHGYNGLIFSTFLASIFIVLFSILKFGKLIKYIPNCVIIGFSLGLGIDILSGQIADFTGIHMHNCENFVKKIVSFINHIQEINIHSLIIGVLSILIISIIRKIKPQLPVFLITIIINCIIANIFNLNIETINSRFGTMHLTFPNLHTTIFEEIQSPINLIQYILPAITIAILASIEALLAATIADKITNSTHKPNTELFALGLANCISSIFGCLPIAGTTARTIVNAKSGAKSSFAGIFHGIFLIILMAIFAESISCVNMPTIAGILFVVSFDMMSFKKIYLSIKQDKKLDIFMLFFTAFCVLFCGIVVAIIINTIVFNILNKYLK